MGWSQAAKRRASEIERDFKNDLRRVADCLADHDRAAAVSALHVHRAFDALASVGLSKKRWIDRPDAETALGGVLVGASFAAPDVVNTLIDETNHKGVAAGVLVALFGIGVFLFFHGSYRATLPSSARNVGTLSLWARRITFAAIAFVILVALVAAAYAYFIARSSEPRIEN